MSDSVRISAELVALTSESDLTARRESLARRLEDGYQRIDEAALAGADVVEWETFWIRLLHEYEGVCRDLDVAA
jgi:hypothetical protein